MNLFSSLFLTSTLLALNSCGSLFKSKDVVPIDSSPRGLYVLNGEGEVLGQTPLYIRVSPKDNDLILKSELTDKGQVHHVNCSVSLSRSIVPNLLPALAGPAGLIISGTFLGTDLISRGMFDCHKGLVVFDKTKVISKPKKKNVLILPFPTNDDSESLEIQRTFLKQQEVDQTVSFIDLQKGNNELIFRGMSYETIRTFEEIDRRNLERVAAKLGATHVVLFESAEKRIQPILYDLFNRQADKTAFASFEYQAQKSKHPWLQKWIQAFNFLPNSVQASYYFQSKTEVEDRLGSERGYIKYRTGDHPDTFPKYLTLLSLDTVEHPNRFNIWDYHFSFYPTFGGSSWNLDFGQKIPNYNISVGAIYALYNAALTGHTFFGAIRIHFGLGPGYFIWSDSDHLSKQELKIVSSIGLTYTAFVNDRWYLRLGSAVYGPTNGLGNDQKMNIKAWEEYHFGIGYYFPTLKDILKNLFRR